MAALHLLDERLCHPARVERSALLRYHRMKENLEKHITQLLAHLTHVAGAERIVELVRLLYQVWSQRLVRLSAIPLAALAQVAHELQRIFESGLVLHGTSGAGILPARVMTRQCKRS